MSYPVGTEVVVRAINRRARVIEVRGDIYRVAAGALVVTCREHDLRPAERVQPSKRKSAQPGSRARGEAVREAPVIRSIDLHGMTVDDARAAVADFVSRAVLEGADQLEVVHGIGRGRVRDAVRRELQRIGAVRAIRPHPRNPGVTIVQL